MAKNRHLVKYAKSPTKKKERKKSKSNNWTVFFFFFFFLTINADNKKIKKVAMRAKYFFLRGVEKKQRNHSIQHPLLLKLTYTYAVWSLGHPFPTTTRPTLGKGRGRQPPPICQKERSTSHEMRFFFLSFFFCWFDVDIRELLSQG